MLSENAYLFIYLFFQSIALLGLTIGGIFTVLFHVILKTPSDSGGGSDNKTKKGPTSWSQIAKDYFKSILLYQVNKKNNVEDVI